MADSTAVVTFDGEEFRIADSMLRTPKPTKQLLQLTCAALAVYAAPRYAAALVLTVLTSGGALALAVLIFGKRVSAKTISYVLPTVMAGVDAKFSRWKAELMKNLSGKVLDVGCASGLYLKYGVRSSATVSEYVALEPNTNLHEKLRQTIKGCGAKFPVTVEGRFTSELEGDGTYDWVILGNVLCEVPDPASVLRDVDRLLKPGGRVFFCEHVVSTSPLTRTLQNTIAPFWHIVSDGCNINRDTLTTIRSATTWSLTHWSTPGGFPGPMVVGLAVKSVEQSKL